MRELFPHSAEELCLLRTSDAQSEIINLHYRSSEAELKELQRTTAQIGKKEMSN